MDLPVNTFKRAIMAGQQQIGFWTALAGPTAAEILAGSGFDWLLLDGEHAPNDVASILAQMQAMMEDSTQPVVRVRGARAPLHGGRLRLYGRWN
ncbi:aldolase/citrate lyase family protein [Afipia sp. Root123D2]|uniref:aldolase/citrate lyase family protein n=1 Tax=Afipia sp. Root123D2 TaxID=1736436 RepID=UPI000A555FA3|nr:aldolase/citrate lyase family protein [Afipia sp. Root123D2]